MDLPVLWESLRITAAWRRSVLSEAAVTHHIDFAKEFDAVYIHYGQAVYAMNKLNAEGTDNISGLQYQDQAGAVSGYCGEDIFYRTSDRPAPHNVYISEEGIKTAMERNGYRTRL